MGVVLIVGRSRFTMPVEAEAPALVALQAAHQREPFSVVLRDDSDELQLATTFELGMAAMAWELRRNRAGAIRGLRWQGDKSTVDEQERLFAAVGPFAEPGSYVELADDASFEPVRLELGTAAIRQIGLERIGAEEDVLEFDDDDDDDDDREPATPRFADLAAPRSRTPYSVRGRFAAGEWLEHPSFGPGLVLEARGDGKLRVLFADAERLLVHGR